MLPAPTAGVPLQPFSAMHSPPGLVLHLFFTRPGFSVVDLHWDTACALMAYAMSYKSDVVVFSLTYTFK